MSLSPGQVVFLSCLLLEPEDPEAWRKFRERVGRKRRADLVPKAPRRTKNFVGPSGVVLRPCSTCGLSKPLSEFNRVSRSTTSAVGFHSRCKSCMVAAVKESYWRNPERRRQRARETRKTLSQPNREWINALKESSPCNDCGRFFPAVCMDFDHLPGVQKVADVAAMLVGSREALCEEVSKCDLVCACCHRVRTTARRKTHPRRKK